MIYNVPKQQLTEYGFTDYTGKQWCDSFVDTYNRFNEMLNKYVGQDIETGSLTDMEVERIKDQRHKNFVQFTQIA